MPSLLSRDMLVSWALAQLPRQLSHVPYQGSQQYGYGSSPKLPASAAVRAAQSHRWPRWRS